MENVLELIRARRSVRTFDGKGLTEEEKAKLLAFASSIENPYGLKVEFRLLDTAEHGLSSPVIAGEKTYIGAKVAQTPHMEEAFGYSFETLVLYAQSLGLGTTWIGGTMDRGLFERRMELKDGERMPCVSPVGHPAAKMSLRETVMRRGVKADGRRSLSELCFSGSFARPLAESEAGDLAEVLRAALRAPSAVNRQPWRIVVCGRDVHFYLKHSRGYVSEATGDLQKVDLGIALCHFALAAEAVGLKARFILADPGLEIPSDCEYIAGYTIE